MLMNKYQFTKLLAQNGSTDFERMTHNAAIEFTDIFLQTLADALVMDGKVKLDNYLVFEVREPKKCAAGQIRNPKTGEMSAPKNRKRLGIRCGKKLRKLIQEYDKNAPHDLAFLDGKKRSNNDYDLDNEPDDDNYDWFSEPDF